MIKIFTVLDNTAVITCFILLIRGTNELRLILAAELSLAAGIKTLINVTNTDAIMNILPTYSPLIKLQDESLCKKIILKKLIKYRYTFLRK